MKAKNMLIGILLACAALTAVLVPCLSLFEEGDWLFYVAAEPAMKRAWIETAVLAFLIAASAFLPKRKIRLIAWGILLLTVTCLHGMLMPVLFAAVYFLCVLGCGGPVQGTATVIIAAAVLSLFKICTPVTLFAVVAAMALLNYLPIRKNKATAGEEGSTLNNGSALKEGSTLKATLKKLTAWINGDSPLSERLLTGAVFLVVLVQIARANNCIDFDSLWYGVRSSYVLAPNGSIFEDLGLVGMVYTYPKGFEILTLPLSGTSSYAVISAFNLCLFLYGLKETGRVAELLAGKSMKQPAMFLTAMVPGIVNMTLSAKPDVITWALQMAMFRIFFETVQADEPECGLNSAGKAQYGAIRVLAVYLLTLTMKPTALIFSTALFGMMSIYGLVLRRKRRNVSVQMPAQEPGPGRAQAISALLLSIFALTAVCIRTYLLTGVPFTSVFTGLFEKLGFSLKYPFAASNLPQSYQEGSVFVTAFKRVVKMLLMPDGKDMSHVIIAWGGSLFFVLALLVLAGLLFGRKQKAAVRTAAWTVFLPFILTCFVTLMMLYQVDGNYYMTLYSAVIFLACMAAAGLSDGKIRAFVAVPVGAVCVFQFVIMTMTNWAGTTGYSEIALNKGYYDHAAYYREALTETDGTIYRILESEPSAKLVAFGTHPDCLQFPCIAESYNDITAPWGNVEIVNSARAFEEYLQFMQADYVYADAEHLKEEAWQWSRGLLEEMTADGTLYDFVYEGDNWLAKVRR